MFVYPFGWVRINILTRAMIRGHSYNDYNYNPDDARRVVLYIHCMIAMIRGVKFAHLCLDFR
jgi:hypothetical protein